MSSLYADNRFSQVCLRKVGSCEELGVRTLPKANTFLRSTVTIPLQQLLIDCNRPLSGAQADTPSPKSATELTMRLKVAENANT